MEEDYNNLDIMEGDYIQFNTTTFEDGYISRDYTFLVVLHIIFAVTFILLNGGLLIIILLNRELRGSPKYFLVMNLLVVGLMIGIICDPLQVSLFLNNMKMVLPCVILGIVETFYTITLGVDMLIMVSICADWIVSITVPHYTSKTRFGLAMCMAGTSWFYSCCLTLFYTIPTASIEYYDETFTCIFILPQYAEIGLLSNYVAPSLLYLFVAIVLLMVVRSKQAKGRYDANMTTAPLPLDIFVAAFLMFIFILPFEVYKFIRLVFQFYYNLSVFFHFALSRLQMVRHMVIPLILLIDRKFRQEVIKRVTCKPYVADNPSIEMSNN